MKYSRFEGRIVYLDTKDKAVVLEEGCFDAAEWNPVFDENGKPESHRLSYDESFESQLAEAIKNDNVVSVLAEDWRITKLE